MITVLQHLVLSGYRWGNGLGNQGGVTSPVADTFGKLISPALCQATSMTN